MISNSSCPGVQWYVDGAHTAESISQCLEWFKRVQGMLSSPREKILVFGCQNDKDPNKIFKAFKESGVHFKSFDLKVTTNWNFEHIETQR